MSRIQSKFEELMASWNPDTSEVGIKKLPIFKGRLGKEEIIGYSLVDEDNYKKWSRSKWRLTNNGYVSMRYDIRNCERLGVDYVSGPNQHLHLQRAVLGLHERQGQNREILADHINGDKTDNRRANLREATRSQNGYNAPRRKLKCTSSYKGVCFDNAWSKKKPWKYAITWDNGKQREIGRFPTELEAAKAYDVAARKYRKEFAFLNFPEDTQ